MPSDTNPQLRDTPIASLTLPDGTMVEMILDANAKSAALAVWKEGILRVQSFVEHEHSKFVPHAPTNNLIAHQVVLFPSTATDFESVSVLRQRIVDFLHRYADLGERFETVASYYVLLTWIFDAFSSLPYLRLRGDFGSGKSRCLQVIGSICYKPMFVSGASTVSPLFRIVDQFRGTLILDESDFRMSDERAEITKILNNGNTPEFPVLRSESGPTRDFNPRAFAVFGPKVIATRGSFDDRALESRCITEVMTGLAPRADIPLNLPSSFHEEALALRNQLLMYRFRHRDTTGRPVEVRSSDIEPRVAQILGPLLALADDAPSYVDIVAAGREQSHAIRAERSSTVEADLLLVIRDFLAAKRPLIVGEIAKEFGARFATEYDYRTITPRWVGSQLRRRFSLVPVKTQGTFSISESAVPRLTQLFKRFGVASLSHDPEPPLAS